VHKIFLKPGKEVPVLRFHPWVFSGAIARTEGQPADGDLVSVHDRSGHLLGIGHFHHGSIAVRLLSFGPAQPELADFWVEKFRTALMVRRTAGIFYEKNATNCYRLLHGEGDGVSGLIVDVYGHTAVLQCHSIGMHRQRALLATALQQVLGDDLTAIYDKSTETLPPQYAATQQNGYLYVSAGTETPLSSAVVQENGVRFRVDWETGQKTGFFLDLRDNRQLLQQYAAGKTVLNAFCYTGGFSAYALRAGAKAVHSVDVSAKAMELTAENVALNAPFTGEHTGITADVMHFLKNTETTYEVLVIDPPAFAKSLDKRHNAVQGYKRLNEAAIRRAAPGAVLFTFSCSQVIDRELFYHTIVAAAMEAGRPARVLHHLTQGPDHPVSLFHAEGAYLKGLVVYLE
jgi:23S rRNA (cytosine1962-C5)-methyltransferase